MGADAVNQHFDQIAEAHVNVVAESDPNWHDRSLSSVAWGRLDDARRVHGDLVACLK